MLFRLESIQFKEGRDFLNVLRFFFFILPLLEIIVRGKKANMELLFSMGSL